MRSTSGFTLIELLIVIGSGILLIGLFAVLGTQTVQNAEFDRVRETIRSELAAAQTDAISGTLDSSWGVKFSSNVVTRFRGATYASRITSFDRVTSFGDDVTISGATEVDFTRPFGLPSASAIVVCSDGTHTATTTVNTNGAIIVQ